MENIEVSVRIRPINQKELQSNDENIWKVENNNTTMTLLNSKMLPSPQQTNSNSGRPSKGPSFTNTSVNAFSTGGLYQPMNAHANHTSTSPINFMRQTSSISPFSQNRHKKKKSKKSTEKHPHLQNSQANLIGIGIANQNSQISMGNNSSQNSFQSQNNNSMCGGSNAQNINAESKRKISYTFDQCFRDEDTNNGIYSLMVKRIALSSLNGINGTVFVYGQTGSGKTYTMLGRERKEVMQSGESGANGGGPNGPKIKSSKKDKLTGIGAGASNENTGGKPPKAMGVQNSNSKKDQSSHSPDTNISMYGQGSPTKQMLHPVCEAAYMSGRKQAQQQEQPGVMIYALEDIFKEIREDKDKTYFLRCSYVEIYNELVFDLLRDQETINECLQLNEDKNKDFYIRGVIEEPVSSIEEILYFLRRGELNRHYAQTKLNHSSSRSHTMFRLQVQSITNNFLHKAPVASTQETASSTSAAATNQANDKNHHTQPSKENKKFVTQSVLNFVDLAGSEKVSSHYDNKDPDEIYVMDFGDQVPKIDEKVQTRIKEGKNINKSLFFLTQVISLRAEGKSQSNSAQGLHIPYRNSPLTKILRSSLGGNARTCVIVCTTPCKSQIEQTLSSLRFGQNAMKIENKVQANIIANNNEEAVKILIADYERKIKSLEKVKKEQQTKKDYELRMIDMLLEEKKKLQDKIHSISSKKFKSLVKATGVCHLLDQRALEYAANKTFFMMNMERAGTLEITEKLGNHIMSLHDKSNFETSLRKEVELKSKKNHPYTEKCYKQMALDVIKLSKQTTLVAQEQAKDLQRCIHELKSSNMKLEERLSQQQDWSTQKQDAIHKMGFVFEELKNENEELKLKEKFYEGFDSLYIQQVKDEWLNALELKFTQIIEKLKEEKARRHYKDKIEGLKDQIRKLQELQVNNNGTIGGGAQGSANGNEQQQTLESVLMMLQQSECQSLIDGVKSSQNDEYHQKTENRQSISQRMGQQDSILDQATQQDASSIVHFKQELDQVLKQCNLTHQKDDSSSQRQSISTRAAQTQGVEQIQKLQVCNQQQNQQVNNKKSFEKRSKSIASQESNFNIKLHKIQDDLKKREDVINQCTNMLEQMHSKIDQGINQGNSTLQEGGRHSTTPKGNNPCLLMHKRGLMKKYHRNKSLQIQQQQQWSQDGGKDKIEVVRHQRRLKSMQKKYGNPNTSFLMNIQSTKSLKIAQGGGDQTLNYSPPKPFYDDQRINFNFFGNFNQIAPQSVTASSALNNFVKDLESIKLTSNLQHSFQMENTPMTSPGIKSIDIKRASGSGLCKQKKHKGETDDDFADFNLEPHQHPQPYPHPYHHQQQQDCHSISPEKKGAYFVLGERHQESFAMTNRESNEDLHSNNLFETLQGNMDQLYPQNELIINANDYVSFKQTAPNNKSNFVIDTQQQYSQSNPKQSFKETTPQSIPNSKRKTQEPITIQDQQKKTSATAEVNINNSYLNMLNSCTSNNIISLNFNENAISSYDINQTASFSQQQKQVDLLKRSNSKASNTKKKQAQRENLEPSTFTSNLPKNLTIKEPSFKLDLLKTQELQILTARENHNVSPINKTIYDAQYSNRSHNKLKPDKTEAQLKQRQSLLGKPQKTSKKGLGHNIFQYSRHQVQNEAKVFQPLLLKQKLQIEIGGVKTLSTINKSNESPISLTPKQKGAKTASKKNVTPKNQ